MRFGPLDAVVLNEPADTRSVYFVVDGQWISRNIWTDADGEPHKLGSPQPLGVPARETQEATRRIVEVSVRAYRNAAALPDDDDFVFMREPARLMLQYLTAGGR